MEMETPNLVMNNELVPMEEAQLIPMETQHMDSELQLDILQTQPDITETPPNYSDAQPPTKRRKKKSIVWEHFTIETVGAGTRRACCKQCKQSFAYSTGSKVAGTSHLKRHIAKGTCPVVLRNQEKNLQAISPYSAPSKVGPYSDTTTPKRRYRTSSSITYHLSFDADRCRHEIARMIIMHDYPLHMVEHPDFLAFVQNLQPRFDMVSFNTVQGDCVATYLREKQSIQKVIEVMPGRICLTLDLWSSCRTVGYMFLTGQFIDSEWKMQHKLLNVIMEPYPDSDTAFSHSVAACLSDWGINSKLLFSVTINQQLSDAAAENLRAQLSVSNPQMLLKGQLLVGNCLARSLSTIVQDTLTLNPVQAVVKKVTDSVKYVKTSESREEKFLELKQQLQVRSSKNLAIDDQTQWNTTYEMLLAASELKEVFSCLVTSDPDYKNAPSAKDWLQIETLCAHLKPLFNTANLLITANTPTTNIFFHEVWNIQYELAHASASEDPFLSTLTKSIKENFNKYWESCCFILAIAVVMDPRFKMKLVEFSFSRIYGKESAAAAAYAKVVDDGIHDLFREYGTALSLPPTQSTYASSEEAQAAATNGGVLNHSHPDLDSSISNNGLGLTDFDVYIMETTSNSKSELDQYLEDSVLPRVHEFDVVGWWKINKVKYPTLSKMALDILSIPVCTVPAASVFDTLRKEMDSYRCSLRPETVEALICAKDWLQSSEKEKAADKTPAPVVKPELPI